MKRWVEECTVTSIKFSSRNLEIISDLDDENSYMRVILNNF